MTDKRSGAMNPQRYARTKALFEVVCDLSEVEQERTLKQFALVDPETAEEVRRLLGFHDPVSAKVEGESAAGLEKNFPQVPNLPAPNLVSFAGNDSAFMAPNTFQAPPQSSRNWIKRNLRFGSWPCFIIGALILVAIFWLNRIELRRQLWVIRTTELDRVADTFQQSVAREIDNNLEHFNQLANERQIRDAIDYMLSRKPPASHRISPDADRRGYLARELILRKQIAMRNYGPVQFVLRNREGFVVAYSLSGANEAALLAEINTPSQHDFYHVQDGQPHIHLPHMQASAITTTTASESNKEGASLLFSDVSYVIPLLSHAGELEAVLTIRDGSAADNLSMLCKQVQFGESGEVVPFDSSGYTLTTTRFSNAVINEEQKILTQ